MLKIINLKLVMMTILGLTLSLIFSCGNSQNTVESPQPNESVNANQVTSITNSYDAKSSLGINLYRVSNWSSELPFLDAFKSSKKWLTQCARGESGCSNSWSTNEYDKLDLDEHGWVKSLPRPEAAPEYTRVATVMFRDIGNYPGGQYVVLYDGEGTIEYKFDANKDEAASRPGKDIINVTPSNAGIYLAITSTDPNKTGNYIRNIHVFKTEYEDNYESEIFNPKFIDKISKFKALRFMDWMNTNSSEQREWKNRPKLEDASYAHGKGVPAEIMIELANRLKIDPWFNMPHMATDQYLTNFAQLVKENLDPDLTIYLEYSNEVWNSNFKQFHWVKDNGAIPGGKTPHQSYGVRTAQMCEIWKEAFAQESNRVKCVMGTHTANPWVAGQVLNCDKWTEAPCYKHGIDALAITGYFSGRLGQPKYKNIVESWIDDPNINEFERALTQLKDGSVLGTEGDNTEDLVKRFNDYSKIAQEKGLELLVYEGGSHVVGKKEVAHNKKLTGFFIELHRKPEFYDRYTEMLEAWKDPEGTRTLFMHFSSIGKPNKWGSWGALEHIDQDSSPRYDALIDFIE
ncbi:MAG: cellulose-binding protein [Symploca sp. SIO2E9]|nr:cellulose-binding protein [Symploca sp. SIO2E9]